MVRSVRSVIAAMVLALVASTVAWAHEGHSHKIMGVVTMVGPDHVMVKTKDAAKGEEKVVTVTVNDKTKILKGTAGAKLSDVTNGQRVVIDVGDGKEPLTAKEIKLGAAADKTGTQ